MNVDFTPFFKKYEELLIAVDSVFEGVQKQYSDCVKCKIGCSDCCYALFDLTLIEALYINHHFKQKFNGQEREHLLEKANETDRNIYKIKRQAYKDYEAGKTEDKILEDMAEKRIRCPLLDEQDKCGLYEHRPITCRFYGIPTSIGGKGHTCGLSDFVEGKPYPTVNLDIIHKKLYDLSNELATSIQSKYVRMGDMLVPLSMALLTVYDETYLGIGDDEKNKEEGKNE